MIGVGLEELRATIAATQTSHWVGRVSQVGRGTVTVQGLSEVAALGEMVVVFDRSKNGTRGEILSLSGDGVIVLTDGNGEGLQIGDKVVLLGQDKIAPHQSWIGRIIDPYGNSIDGEPLLGGSKPRPLRAPPPNPAKRRGLGGRLETGLSILNSVLPIVRGQRIGLFAGSGVGKSTLTGKLASSVQADVVVIAMIGERGREVREFAESILGPRGMRRSIIVAATSDQSPITRRRCAWAGMAVAEHFRDQGLHVLFIADSLTRFAEAHREIALTTGELASMRGYPPSTAPLLTALCERAGPGDETGGDITAVLSVLVAGSDMEEPIADILRGTLDGHIVLDRHIAERGRFPAIDILRSVSRALPQAADADENQIIARTRQLLGAYENNEMMIRAGLYTSGSDPEIDAAIHAWPLIDAFAGTSEHVDAKNSFRRLAACLSMEGDEVPRE